MERNTRKGTIRVSALVFYLNDILFLNENIKKQPFERVAKAFSSLHSLSCSVPGRPRT